MRALRFAVHPSSISQALFGFGLMSALVGIILYGDLIPTARGQNTPSCAVRRTITCSERMPLANIDLVSMERVNNVNYGCTLNHRRYKLENGTMTLQGTCTPHPPTKYFHESSKNLLANKIRDFFPNSSCLDVSFTGHPLSWASNPIKTGSNSAAFVTLGGVGYLFECTLPTEASSSSSSSRSSSSSNSSSVSHEYFCNGHAQATSCPSSSATSSSAHTMCNLPPDAAAYWAFEEERGTRFATVGRYDLSEVGGTIPSADGKIGRATAGPSGTSLQTLTPALANPRYSSFTVASWIKPGLGGGISPYTKSGTNYSWYVGYDTTNLKRFYLDIAGTRVTANTFGEITPGAWYFVVASFDATTRDVDTDVLTKKISFSINGGEPDIGTVEAETLPTVDRFITGNGMPSASYDETGVWSRVLTQEEILKLYNDGQGLTLTCGPAVSHTSSVSSHSSLAPIPAGCGNGIKTATEECDDHNNRDGDGCSRTCTTEAGYSCQGTITSTCAPLCGNGVVNTNNSETCDDQNHRDGDGCSAVCTIEPEFTCSGSPSQCRSCGNGIKESGEPCEDGNHTAGDGCSPTCTVESGFNCVGWNPNVCTRICGNGQLNNDEACDDRNRTNGDGCHEDCTIESGFTCSGEPSHCKLCGNGIQEAGETCDDQNHTSGDGCGETCIVESGFSCTGTPSTCTRYCGNGAINLGETCDDQNRTAGDGCGATCAVESGYTCSGTPSVCSLLCGNGILDSGESCDDQNRTAGDGCSSTCVIESGFTCSGTPSSCKSCGNGIRETGEACDDQNQRNSDGCSSSCAIESGYTCSGSPSSCALLCGNSVIDAGETCDDQNPTAGDGCSATCAIETGFVCSGVPSQCETLRARVIRLADTDQNHTVSETEARILLLNVIQGLSKPFDQVRLFDLNSSGTLTLDDVRLFVRELNALFP